MSQLNFRLARTLEIVMEHPNVLKVKLTALMCALSIIHDAGASEDEQICLLYAALPRTWHDQLDIYLQGIVGEVEAMLTRQTSHRRLSQAQISSAALVAAALKYSELNEQKEHAQEQGLVSIWCESVHGEVKHLEKIAKKSELFISPLIENLTECDQSFLPVCYHISSFCSDDLRVVLALLASCGTVIWHEIVVGVKMGTRVVVENPFLSPQVFDWILTSLNEHALRRVQIHPMNEKPFDRSTWVCELATDSPKKASFVYERVTALKARGSVDPFDMCFLTKREISEIPENKRSTRQCLTSFGRTVVKEFSERRAQS